MQTNQRQLQQLQQRLNQISLEINLDKLKGEFTSFQSLKQQHLAEVQKQKNLKKREEDKLQKTFKPKLQVKPIQDFQFNNLSQDRIQVPALSKPISLNCSFDEEIFAELEQYAFTKGGKQQSTQSQHQVQKKQIYRFDKNYGFCLKKELFEELVDRLKYIRKSILKKENVSEEEHIKIIPTSYLVLLSQYLPLQPMDIQKYKDFQGTVQINQGWLDKFFNEIKFFMKKNDIDKDEIFYEPNMFESNKVEDEDLDYDSLFGLVELNQIQQVSIGSQNFQKVIL